MNPAWPRLEIDPGEPGPMEFDSLGLAVLARSLVDGRKYNILDLGAAQGPNVEYFSHHASKIYIEDLYDGLSRLDDGAGDVSERELAELLTHDRAAHFDLVIAWDLFDYLSPATIARLVKLVRPVVAEGALCFLLTSTRQHIPSRPAKYTIVDAHRLSCVPYSKQTRPNPNHTPLALERLMKGFQLVHSFMLKNGMQEYVFSALAAGPRLVR